MTHLGYTILPLNYCGELRFNLKKIHYDCFKFYHKLKAIYLKYTFLFFLVKCLFQTYYLIIKNPKNQPLLKFTILTVVRLLLCVNRLKYKNEYLFKKQL